MNSTIGHGWKWLTCSVGFLRNNASLLRFYPLHIIVLFGALLVSAFIPVLTILLVIIIITPVEWLLSLFSLEIPIIILQPLGILWMVTTLALVYLVMSRANDAVLLALTQATNDLLNDRPVSVRNAFQLFVDIQAEESGVSTENLDLRKWMGLLLLSSKTFPGVFAGPALDSLSDHVRSAAHVFKRPISICGEQDSIAEIAPQVSNDLYGESEDFSLGIYQATIGVMCFTGLIAVILLSIIPLPLEIRLVGLLLAPLVITILGSAYAVFLSTIVRMVLYNYWKTGDCPEEFKPIIQT